jgi:hypothetical protein
MRWRIKLGPRRTPLRQRLLPFRERSDRLDRWFKRGIVAATAAVVTAAVAGTPAGRYAVARAAEQGRQAAQRLVGLEPDRGEVDALWRLKRRRGVEQTRKVLADFYRHADPAMRHLFDVAGMSPDKGLVRWGRDDAAFLISSKVFEPDDRGRSYRMRPETRSVWLRRITLHDGPFGLFQVPHTPEVRAAAVAAGAVVDEGSAQRTNSWGCRGPEPDPNAAVRGVVLGDSFMQAMFNGEGDTPALGLERFLREAWGVPVSVLNSGHIGYSPEQYFYTLVEYGERFRPHFVVVSVCPNDFGEYVPVLGGGGDGYDEAKYWLGRIGLWCRGRSIPCVLVAVPCDYQIVGSRNDGGYPGRVSNLFEGSSPFYCDPLELFIDEHLRLTRGREPSPDSPLYNYRIRDNHFSPAGAALWGRVVGRRVSQLVKPPRSLAASVRPSEHDRARSRP